MLASLLNNPKTPADWSRWTFALQQDTVEIEQAIQAQKGVFLPTYQLDPLPPADTLGWLERNQAAHNNFNGVLGLQGSDLESVDLKNEREKQVWVYLVYQERYSARAALRI